MYYSILKSLLRTIRKSVVWLYYIGEDHSYIFLIPILYWCFFKIRLISNPGNTIKVVAEITTADSINGHYIIKATQLVSAVSGEVTPTERYNIRRLDIIPILKYKTGQVSNEVYHIIIHMFLATDPELTVEFRFYNEALNIQRISIKIYKSYA